MEKIDDLSIKEKKIDALFSKFNKTGRPGCVVCIIYDGEIIYNKGFGLANIEKNISINSKSIFYMASVSKQFSASCIALLEEQGKISIKDEVRKYIPELFEFKTPITVEHLIRHTSGYRDYFAIFEDNDEKFNFNTTTSEQVLKLISQENELKFIPGTKFNYCNTGYFLISELIKRISGISMRNYADKYIFKPLNMKHTLFHDERDIIIDNKVLGYGGKKSGNYVLRDVNSELVGSGGLFSCIGDLFLWDQNFYHNKIGSNNIFSKILSKGNLKVEKDSFKPGKDARYAYGNIIETYLGIKDLIKIYHSGALLGFRTGLARFPNQKFSVIILANYNKINIHTYTKKIAGIYLSNHLSKK